MCKWGTVEKVKCTIIAGLSYTGKQREKLVKVDKCIAHIVRALSEAGIKMTSSCCGHGEKDGQIMLDEGLLLTVIKVDDFRSYVDSNGKKGRRMKIEA